MEKKFRDWGLVQKDSDDLIDELVENNFINEGRFILAFARGKFNNNKWGRHKIRMALREKGLKEEDISKTLKKLDAREYEKTARQLLQRKWEDLSGLDGRTRNSKTYYYMVSKGFEPDVFIPFLKELSK